MAKSLQEIEQAFHDQFQQEDLKMKEKIKEEKQEKEKQKGNKISLISDTIFVLALIGGTLSAIILSWSEKSGYSGNIYTIFNEYRTVILIGLIALIVISFFLRFISNNEKTND